MDVDDGSQQRERDESVNSRRGPRIADALLPILPLACFIFTATHYRAVAAGETISYTWQWVPSLDVAFSFYFDGLSLLFAALISGIGVMIFTYAPGYFGSHPDRGRLYGWLVVFMFAMLGLVLANDIVTLFVFWELTSVSSYMLIGFKHESEKARAAALQALLVTGLGGLALLAGLVLLGQIGDSHELTELLAKSDQWRSHPLCVAVVVLILLGAFTKSAQFPFHFWLPGAMAAPTPVSAYLHSATMVKAGVYLVARLSPAFDGVLAWNGTIIGIGCVTALVGALLAIQQTDLKRILAYSTVSALGVLMLLLGLGTTLAVTAAVMFLLCHSFYKAALFLVAGTVDHCTGSRDITRLGKLAPAMPLAATAAVLAGLSMAGVPPAGGFIAKEMVYESAIHLPRWAWVALAAVLLVNIAFVVVASLCAVRAFFSAGTKDAVGVTQKPNFRLGASPFVLGVVGIVIGVAPATFAQDLVNSAIASIAPAAEPVKLKLWHGWNFALLLSIGTLVAGIGLYACVDRFRGALSPARQLAGWGPAAGYDFCLRALKATAAGQTRILQNGRLRIYLLIILLAFLGIVGLELVDPVRTAHLSSLLEVRPFEVFVPVLILCGALMAVTTSSRLSAVCALGVVGYAVAMLFVMYGAPDLAMTQLAIETLTVVLFVFVLYRLPRFASLTSRATRVRDAVVAVAGGGVMTAVVLVATAEHAPSRVTQYYVENSWTVAKGRNLVNVILVDFRSMDTLAEITVLAIAALGIFALMRLRLTPSNAGAVAAGALNTEDATPDKSSETGRR